MTDVIVAVVVAAAAAVVVAAAAAVGVVAAAVVGDGGDGGAVGVFGAVSEDERGLWGVVAPTDELLAWAQNCWAPVPC